MTDVTRASNAGPAAEPTFDPATLHPFTDGKAYLGRYETALYPGASNEMPEAHRRTGERLAGAIRPLDLDGQPDDQEGRILALALGHSNCRMYFEAFRRFLGFQPVEDRPRFEELWSQTAERLAGLAAEALPEVVLHPHFELLSAAVGGQQLPQIVQLEGPVWDRARDLLARPGYSARQVQVLFFHTTYHGANNRDRVPPRPFPETMRQMQREMAIVLEHCLRLYPNLKLAYLTADGFRHYTGFEPHVWQEAFAIKWLIESQTKGEPGTACEGEGRRLPWLAWGPYIWDNRWDESYFIDGVHPSPKALAIFVQKYWDHLRRDSVARPWLLKR